MLLSQHYLQDGLTRISSIDRQLRSNTDLDGLKSRYYGVILEMCMAAEENYFTTGRVLYREFKDYMVRSLDTVRASNDFEEVKDIIREIREVYLETLIDPGLTISDFKRDVYSKTMYYNEINAINMDMLASSIQHNDRTINLLDPRCRSGENLAAIKRNIPKSVAYGIEQENSSATQAKNKLDRVAVGTFTGSRISNDAFDVTFMEPPISWNMNTVGTTFSKQEKLFLNNISKYPRQGGVMMIVIPYFRLYKDICVFISKYMTDVQVRRLSGSDFSEKGLIVIAGIRSSGKEPDDKIYRMLRGLHTVDDQPQLHQTPLTPMTLPTSAAVVDTFRGSVLDTDEMYKIVQTSGCQEAFWAKQDVEKLSENAKQPLLPFNIGQIGLVLTSGCLDGVVDEGDGHFHVIKGRVSKKSFVERDILDPRNVEVTETISNRVEINVILPNGEHKVLA